MSRCKQLLHINVSMQTIVSLQMRLLQTNSSLQTIVAYKYLAANNCCIQLGRCKQLLHSNVPLQKISLQMQLLQTNISLQTIVINRSREMGKMNLQFSL